MAIAAALLILLLAAPSVYGVQYIVGDTDGWASSVNYDTWASGKTFTVGDSLLFNYGGSHKVDVVNQANYNACSSSNVLHSYTDGASTVNLTVVGPVYFICPTPGHCANGMKLTVTVVAATGTPTTPTTPSSTPSPSPPSTPTSNDSPPPPPPPPHNNGPASSLGMSMLGLPLVLAALVAFMG